MRQGQQNRRGRGRNRKGQSPLSRNFESNGPDVKIRGTAVHVAEKYMALARDAVASGDQVLAENYLQHAEHYNRIIMAAQQQSQPHDPMNGQRVRREFDQPMFGDSMGGDGGYDGPDEEGDEQPSDAGFGGENPRFLDPVRYNEQSEPRQGFEPRGEREHQREPREFRQHQYQNQQGQPQNQGQDYAPRQQGQGGGYEPRYGQDQQQRQSHDGGRHQNDQRGGRRRRGRYDNGGRQHNHNQGQQQGGDGGNSRDNGGGEAMDSGPSRSPGGDGEGVVS